MDMNPELSQIEPRQKPLTLEAYESLAMQFAEHGDRRDPEGTLRRGLIEETAELLDTDPSDKEEFSKEVGDILWYCAAIMHQRGESLVSLFPDGKDQSSTGELIEHNLPLFSPLPIYAEDGEELPRGDSNRSSLAIDILRLIDLLNPKTPMLWIGIQTADHPPVASAVKSVLYSLHNLASEYKIAIDESAQKTLDKLASRDRKPHVIDEKDITVVNSAREQVFLALDKHARRMFTQSI